MSLLYPAGEIIRSKMIMIFVAGLLAMISSLAAMEKVTVAGSSTVLPLGEAAAEAFNFEQKDYLVSVTGGGTGAGITGIAEGRFDIAMASREVTPVERKRYGNGFVEHLVGYDGIVVAVSKPIYQAGIASLSKDQLRKIYAGEINSWRDLGGPDEEIYVVSREQGSGTRDTFDEVIMGDKGAETPGVDTVALGSAEVKTALAGSDKAIGYLGFSYAKGGNIEPIALDGVMPSVQSIRNGSYELSRKLYFYTFGKPKDGANAFIAFAMGPEGQQTAERMGFVPLAEPIPIAKATPRAQKAPATAPGWQGILAGMALLGASWMILRRRA
jgi:phosphate transport system substrate-binding protein